LKQPLLAALLLVLATAPASADSRVKLFPLGGGGVPKSMKGAPGELSRVLARSLGAELTTVPIEDAAGLMDCNISERSCLREIARSVGVGTIVFGRLEMHGDDGEIVLTSFDGTSETRKTITIAGDDVDELVASLKDKLEPRKEIPVAPPIKETPVEQPSGGVSSGTWGMIIGGGVGIGAGLAFIASANGIKGQVNKAPTTTRDDIDRLVALEKAGKARMQIGGALMGVGGLVATIGIVRMVMQRHSKPERAVLDVVPESGGASVFLTVHR
jgi:hypothetical protein